MIKFLSLIQHVHADVQTDLSDTPVNNVGDYVNLLLPRIMEILGGVALLVVIFAGYLYMTSQGEQSKITLAKELIIGAITGILLLFLIGVLRNQIGF